MNENLLSVFSIQILRYGTNFYMVFGTNTLPASERPSVVFVRKCVTCEYWICVRSLLLCVGLLWGDIESLCRCKHSIIEFKCLNGERERELDYMCQQDREILEHICAVLPTVVCRKCRKDLDFGAIAPTNTHTFVHSNVSSFDSVSAEYTPLQCARPSLAVDLQKLEMLRHLRVLLYLRQWLAALCASV